MRCAVQLQSKSFSHASRHRLIRTYICTHTFSNRQFCKQFREMQVALRRTKRRRFVGEAKHVSRCTTYIMCMSIITEHLPHRFFKHPHREINGKYREQILSRAAELRFLFHFIAYDSQVISRDQRLSQWFDSLRQSSRKIR